MKSILIFIFFFPFFSFAAKTYQFEFIVKSNLDYKPVAGVEVILSSENEGDQRQTTNENGKVVFTVVKNKEYSYQVLGEPMKYSNWSSTILVKSRKYLTETIFLTPPPKDPSAFIAECEKLVDAFFATTGKDLVVDTTIKCGENYDVGAEFPGGYKKMGEYINTFMTYPQEALEMGVEGKVYTRFIIGYDGTVEDVKIIRGLHPSMDQEAIRIIKAMPRWIPGYCGKYLRKSYFDLPLTFHLD